MTEYDGGYILPHLSDYVRITMNGALHGKIGSELEEISMVEAAKRVLYNFYEENAWNIEGISVVVKHPKTPSEVAMKRFVDQVGLESLSSALEWCQEISYGVLKRKREVFKNFLRGNDVLENVGSIR